MPGGAGPWGSPQSYMAPSATYGQKAGFWIRFAALLIDGLITGAFYIPAFIVLRTGSKETYRCDRSLGENNTGSFICERPTGGTIALAGLLALVAFAGVVVYYGLMEGKGATVGKSAVNLRVVDMYTGAPIGTGRAVGRTFARILSGLVCYLGYFWMLWDPNKQTWHDKMTNSVVITT
jgi:uncharacterized RDD family membrane protein YckC